MKRYFGYVLMLVFFLFFAYIFYARYKLKSDYILANATIISVGRSMTKNGNWLIEYKFVTAAGEEIMGKGYFPVIMPTGKNLTSRWIPVTYSPNKPEINQLLIYRRTWEQYGLTQPDSLIWLKEYIDLNKSIFSY